MDLGDLIDEVEPSGAEFDVNTTSDANKTEENADKIEENVLEGGLQNEQSESKHGELSTQNDFVDEKVKDEHVKREDDLGEIVEGETDEQVKSKHLEGEQKDYEHDNGQAEQLKEHVEGEYVEGEQLPGKQLDGEHIKGEHIEGEHIEGEHIKGEHIKGEHIEGEHIEGEHIEGEHIEGEHIKGEHIEGEHIEGEHTDRGNIDGEHIDKEHIVGEHIDGEHIVGEHIDGEHIDGEHIDGEHVDGEHIDGEHVDAEHIDGEHIDGEHIDGEHVDGEYVEGEQLKSEPPEGEHVEGEITEGENLEGEGKIDGEMVGEEFKGEQEEQLGEEVPEEDEYYEPPVDPAAPYDLTDSKEALRPAYKLRPDQIVELESLWQLYQDYTPAYSDIDDYITSTELIYMLKCLNLMTHTPEQLQELIDFCVRPSHSKGHINYDQFTHIVKIRLRDISAEEELRFALQVMDPDGTGILDREFLKEVLSTKGHRMGPKNLDNLIKEVDISQDGTIGIEDVVGTMAIDLNTEDLEMLRAAIYPPDKLLGHEHEHGTPEANKSPEEDED